MRFQSGRVRLDPAHLAAAFHCTNKNPFPNVAPLPSNMLPCLSVCVRVYFYVVFPHVSIPRMPNKCVCAFCVFLCLSVFVSVFYAY